MYFLENCKAFSITLSNVGWSSRAKKISENPYFVFFQTRDGQSFVFPLRCLQRHYYLLRQLTEIDMFDQWPHRVQVWSSSLKPLLFGLSWACLDAADVCLAGHVRTDCSYSGCQLYIQTSQQDIWWLPFFPLQMKFPMSPFFIHNAVQKTITVWVLWSLIQTFEVAWFFSSAGHQHSSSWLF